MGAAMGELRDFMFANVYLAEAARREHAKIDVVVRTLFDHYCEHPGEIPPLDGLGMLRRGKRRTRCVSC